MSNCPCDGRNIFPTLDIAAGLEDLPRQIGGFAQFRRAMLAALRQHAVLDGWQARDEDDLGVMLLEMWAYVCDVLAFYDEVIANENYLRTADLRPSLRKLTGLLGYVPRPAVSAAVLLTALAEGRKALDLKPGIAFRSEAFDDDAPQVFELDRQTTIHPLNNSWKLDPQRSDAIGSGTAAGGAHDFILLKEENKRVQKHDMVLIQNGGSSSVHTIEKRSEMTGGDDETYIRLDLVPALSIGGSTKLEDIALVSPTQTVGLWTMGTSPTAVPSGETRLILDGLYRQLKAGQTILVSKGEEYRWFRLDQVGDTMMNVTTGGSFDVTNTEDETVTLTIPAAKAPATQLTLDRHLNHASRKAGGAETWNNGDRTELIVHYALTNVGELTRQRDTSFDAFSDLAVAPARGRKLETPVDGQTASSFVLQDVNQVSVQGNGSVDYTTGGFDFQGIDWSEPLTPPVKVFGNVMHASRGETVNGEVLGSGDASQSHQTFTLKRNPLTYLAAPTSEDERGVSSTLTVWVDGVKWQEVSSFYGQEKDAEVYIVRQNDDHQTQIIFGDGRRGRRLPSGSGNVVAGYRFGAGAAAPPANTITQLAKPVKGLKSVNNPFTAAGGDDAEEAEGIRDYAPQSALLLGRVVSLQDFIAATAGLSGVLAVHGQWRWNNRRQRPVVQIWYIGDSDSTVITTALHNLADPAVALDVDKAVGVDLTLVFDVEVDDAYVEKDVLDDVRSLLIDEETGLLSPKNIGIGQPLYRSRLFAAVLSVPGTVAVTHMAYRTQSTRRKYWRYVARRRHRTLMSRENTPFNEIAIASDPGFYFDVEGGGLIINGKERFDD